MPLYEFECSACGEVVEVMLLSGQKAPRRHDCAEKGKLVKLISAPAIQFKGEGWYVTDYGKGGKKQKKDGGESDTGSKSSESSSESSDSSSGKATSDEKPAKKDKKKAKS